MTRSKLNSQKKINTNYYVTRNEAHSDFFKKNQNTSGDEG